MVNIVTSESAVWAALRLDLVDDGSSPTELVPADRDHIVSLIAAAETRIEILTGLALDELEEVPEPLTQAIILDVSAHYFNRVNPELPEDYDSLIAPYREFGFGA